MYKWPKCTGGLGCMYRWSQCTGGFNVQVALAYRWSRCTSGFDVQMVPIYRWSRHMYVQVVSMYVQPYKLQLPSLSEIAWLTQTSLPLSQPLQEHVLTVLSLSTKWLHSDDWSSSYQQQCNRKMAVIAILLDHTAWNTWVFNTVMSPISTVKCTYMDTLYVHTYLLYIWSICTDICYYVSIRMYILYSTSVCMYLFSMYVTGGLYIRTYINMYTYCIYSSLHPSLHAGQNVHGNVL